MALRPCRRENMRIDTKPAVITTAAPPARGRAGASFSLGSAAGASRSSATANAQTLTGVSSLILLQSEDDPAERRRRSAKRGHDLLDALDRLKAALVAGRAPAADLQRIVTTLKERAGASGDAGLDDILAHIELRAQVELAKRERQSPRIEGARE